MFASALRKPINCPLGSHTLTMPPWAVAFIVALAWCIALTAKISPRDPAARASAIRGVNRGISAEDFDVSTFAFRKSAQRRPTHQPLSHRHAENGKRHTRRVHFGKN